MSHLALLGLESQETQGLEGNVRGLPRRWKGETLHVRANRDGAKREVGVACAASQVDAALGQSRSDFLLGA